MPFFEAIRLALGQIRVQKLKSFFTLLGVTISVMFLIAVVSIVQGMSVYIEQDFAAKWLGVSTFNLRRYPDVHDDVSDKEQQEWNRRPKITMEDAMAVREALPSGVRWAMHSVDWMNVSSAYVHGGAPVLGETATPEYFRTKDLGSTQGRL